MHSHILVNVDDGPETIEETFRLFEQAIMEGITAIIATSHALHPKHNVHVHAVHEQIAQLQQEIDRRNMPLTLYPGHEVRLAGNILELYKKDQLLTLAHSNYLLLELPSGFIPTYTRTIIYNLLTAGITPIIAHPERNKAIAENPSRLENLIREGALAQITAGSLAGLFGKTIQQLSLKLVRSNLVHTYGSDVHNLKTRPFLFEKGLRFLEKQKELNAVDDFLENNTRIINNQPFIVYEPENNFTKRRWKLF
ncbi:MULTISPECIES: tyrosine-protein phosphatase [unclassified Lysinibacillus]|uniref:tyrosine-protein phosphatase n=1 Tax=unclassified Lysinibacillus TaxID=2636778 RepID=UPI003823707C